MAMPSPSAEARSSVAVERDRVRKTEKSAGAEAMVPIGLKCYCDLARAARVATQKPQEPAIPDRCGSAHSHRKDLSFGGPILRPLFSVPRIVNLFLYFLTVVIWGTTWIAIKLQLGVVAIPVSIFYRFALAGLVLFAALLLTRKLQKLDRRGHWLCAGQGLCLFCLNFLCFYTATQWIPSGLVSVVFSAATLWNALNARLWFGTRVASRVMLAGVFGFSGLVLLFLSLIHI